MELRAAAVNAADPQAALRDKAARIKGLLPSDTLESQTLVKIVDKASTQVSGESQETRKTQIALGEIGSTKFAPPPAAGDQLRLF